MIKADKYFIENLNKIISEGSWDENPRPKWSDGASAHSKFITGVFEEYDLNKGEFPITTLRNTAIKTGIREMLTIYQKQVNTSAGFKEMGVDWWEDWMNESGNIGRAYSYNIESHRENDVVRQVVSLSPRILSEEKDGIIIGEQTIESLNFSHNEVKRLKKIWKKMIRECYDDEFNKLSNDFVKSEWISFINFLKDVRYLPQYHLAKESDFRGWVLDKNYYGSNCYSAKTAVFLRKSESRLYKSNKIKPIKITYKDGVVSHVLDFEGLSIKLGVSKKIAKLALEKGKYKDFVLEPVVTADKLWRLELSRNQINSLIENLIRDKYSRRHITSFWNWANIDKKALVECAYETIWSVRKSGEDYYLDMTLNQRSSDYIAANYINKIQYVALQMMVASHCGYKLGKFCHLVQNLHIYDKHMDSVNELLERVPLDINPKLELKSNKSFYEFTVDDFIITGVENIKKLKNKLPISV